MKEVLILEDKSETRKVLAGLVKEVRSDAVFMRLQMKRRRMILQ